MKLQTRFIQLPLLFDAKQLASEIASIDEADWRPHPAAYEGNDFLPLVSAFGDPANEAFEGPMRPTPYLSEARPYLVRVLTSLGAVIGRTRLMRLSPKADVDEHVDVNYYWRDRMRVHVPIVTQPGVRFNCGDATVHMAAGECWIFDTWSLHGVQNDTERSRVHLVVDTIGGEGFWDLLMAGRVPGPPTPNWTPRGVDSQPGPATLEFETVNVPAVMSPWELREHIGFLLSEAAPNQPALPAVARAAAACFHRWRALWALYGDDRSGLPRYRKVLDKFVADLKASNAHELYLRNEISFMEPLHGQVLSVALHG